MISILIYSLVGLACLMVVGLVLECLKQDRYYNMVERRRKERSRYSMYKPNKRI